MKNLLLNLSRWLLPFLGIGTVASCQKDDNNPDDIRCEYGTPVMEYRISGKVTDSKTGTPLKGIAVTYVNAGSKNESPEIIKTSEKGEFVCSGEDFPAKSAILKFSDVDGLENGGEFQPKEVKVQLVKKDGTKDGWFEGVFEAENLLVNLDKVSE